MTLPLASPRPPRTVPRHAARTRISPGRLAPGRFTPRGALLVPLVALIASGTLATPVAAHQYWLAPSRYAIAPRQEVEVGALAGTGFRGERKPWSPSRCVRFVARSARTIDLARAAAPGELTWARFAPVDQGGAMLALESDFVPIELPADRFDAYLEDEGLLGPLAARRRTGTHAPGRERYRRCAKTWLAGHDVARAREPLGLPLEIVPRDLPGASATLRVAVLRQGRPLAGAPVQCWRTPLGATGIPLDGERRDSVSVAWRGRTGPAGEVVVPCAAEGEWLVSVVHMDPCRATEVADWESTWSSLTFARLPGARTGP